MPPRQQASGPEDFLAELLGMSEEHARLFRMVTHRGPMTASEAAKALGKNRPRGYEIVGELVRLGLMVEMPGRPVRYDVASIHQLLADKQQELAERALRLAAARESLPNQTVPLAQGQRATIFTGTNASVRQAATLVRRAESIVVVVGKDCLEAANSEDLLQALKAHLGGPCTLVAYLEDDSGPQMRRAAHDATGQPPILYAASGFPDLAGVATEKGVLFMVPESTRRPETRAGVQIESQVIGEFVCLAVQGLLHPAKSIPVQDPAGDAFTANYKRALQEATRSIDVMAGAGWAKHWPRGEVEDICGLYLKAIQRGVQVRILLQNSMPEMLVAWETGLIQAAEVRMVAAVPLLMCIVDEELVLKGVGDGHRVISIIHQDPHEVRFSHEVFSRLWDSSTAVDKDAAQTRDVARNRTTSGRGPPS